MDYEITPKRLYIIGMISLFIVGLMGVINFFVYFQLNNIYSKIASIASITFNFAIAAFFYYMISLEPKIEEVASSDDIEEVIAALNGEKPRGVLMIDEGGKIKKKKK